MIDQDCLKLTTYFGERDRLDTGARGGRLVADALLDLYDSHHLTSSILLRGAEGFGRLHHLHTDQLLSLSEDLPVVSMAIDRREVIEPLVGAVRQIHRRGLITLERARMLSGEIGEVELAEQLHEATKLTVFVGRQERARGRPAHIAVCDLLHERGIAGATALLGVDGTRHGHRQRAGFFGRNTDVPMMVMAVGAGPTIADILPQLGVILTDPLLTVERVRVCKRDGRLLTRPHALPATDDGGLAMWQKLTIFTAQNATWEGRSLSHEIVRRLRSIDSAGVTSVRGVWGFHGDHAPRGDRLLQIRRHVPVVITTVDTPQRTAAAFEVIDRLTAEQGLVTSEMVPAMTAISAGRTVGGLRLADHSF